jgi:hypothetical protein
VIDRHARASKARGAAHALRINDSQEGPSRNDEMLQNRER